MFHLHIRYIAKSTRASAQKAVSYIARTGRYKKRGDKVRILVSLNMPVWASTQDGAAYWQAADSTRNRANARLGYLIEYALPRALPEQAQSELAGEFATAVSVLSAEGNTPYGAVPVTYGIHEGHGRNPHVHMLVATSIPDGIARAPGAWFMRHNPKEPEKGGAQRSRFMAKTTWLERVRELWADLANRSLKLAGFPQSLDHRSHATRGILLEPGIHLGPSAGHLLRQGRPAPRVEKHTAVTKRNEELVALQEQIRGRRRQLKLMDLQDMVEVQTRRVWEAFSALKWQNLLAGHPLSGEVKSLQSSATLCVIEADRSNSKRVYEAARCESFEVAVSSMVDTKWDKVKTLEGLWLVRPDCDEVVFIGPGYVATDSEDGDAVSASIIAASALPYLSPMIVVQSAVHEQVVSCLQKLGFNWPVRMARGNSQTHLPIPKHH